MSARAHVILEAVIVTLLIVFLAGPADAELVTLTARGTVDSVDSPLDGTFSIGDTFISVWTFDSETADTNSSPYRGNYVGAITAVTVLVRSTEPYSAYGYGGHITVFDNLAGRDQYRIDLMEGHGFAGRNIGGFDLSPNQNALMQLEDYGQTAFDSDALPTTLDASAFGNKWMALQFDDPEDPDNNRFITASLDVISVPATFVAQGTVTQVDPPLDETFSLGDVFTVIWTCDMTAPDTEAAADEGAYDAILGVFVVIGSYVASGNGGRIMVWNDTVTDLDGYRIEIPPWDALTGPSVAGYDVASAQYALLNLIDPSETAFASDALPAVLDVCNFTETGMTLAFGQPLDWKEVKASVGFINGWPTFLQMMFARGYCVSSPADFCTSDADCSSGSCAKAAFAWPLPVFFDYVVGQFATSADIGSYSYFLSGSGGADFFTHQDDPAEGLGFWYLARPDCATGGSWQSAPYAEPQRDVVLP